ncbi:MULTISPECIES: hypothetical protein [Streptomyces]|uniref:Uncharacterized protein n=1 Tax=Streptomyces siderophoricus TaxID=2802281 RepID=A0ABS1MSG1_9ACTN|nr:hypothetical protein [Streptomyces sp. 9-7]MBL1090725.1 hypothetical protein [Streptomyces sp. 9-7]
MGEPPACPPRGAGRRYSAKDLPLDQAYDAFTGLTGTFVDRYRNMDCTAHGDAVDRFHPRKG